jgi:hypothetical protein
MIKRRQTAFIDSGIYTMAMLTRFDGYIFAAPNGNANAKWDAHWGVLPARGHGFVVRRRVAIPNRFR